MKGFIDELIKTINIEGCFVWKQNLIKIKEISEVNSALKNRLK